MNNNNNNWYLIHYFSAFNNFFGGPIIPGPKFEYNRLMEILQLQMTIENKLKKIVILTLHF